MRGTGITTYAVDYDDGDHEEHVPPGKVKRKSTSHGHSEGAATASAVTAEPVVAVVSPDRGAKSGCKDEVLAKPGTKSDSRSSKAEKKGGPKGCACHKKKCNVCRNCIDKCCTCADRTVRRETKKRGRGTKQAGDAGPITKKPATATTAVQSDSPQPNVNQIPSGAAQEMRAPASTHVHAGDESTSISEAATTPSVAGERKDSEAGSAVPTLQQPQEELPAAAQVRVWETRANLPLVHACRSHFGATTSCFNVSCDFRT